MNSSKQLAVLAIGLMLSSTPLAAMGGGSFTTTQQGPQFVHPQKNEPNVIACITAGEESGTEVELLSFTGSTCLGGVKCETDTFGRNIHLLDLKSLIIKQAAYSSPRHPHDLCIRADVVLKDGAEVHDLLIPSQLQFSAKSRATGMELYGYLRDIRRIDVMQPQPMPLELIKQQAYAKQAS